MQKSKIAEHFIELFKGHDGRYGVFKPNGKKREDGKLEGSYVTITKPLTIEAYIKHIAGEEGLVLCPIDTSNRVHFAVIDVDVYGKDHSVLLRALVRLNLPIVPFLSKSGGIHLYLFFLESPLAKDVIPIMRKIVQLLGLPKTTEIFPKQAQITSAGGGSLINLPYFNAENTDRPAITPQDQKMSIEQALNIILQSVVKLSSLIEVINNLPLAKAPPCLQTMFLSNNVFEGQRNEFLFNCATYLKARFKDDFEAHLLKINSMLDNPVSEDEVIKTVASSHKRGDYSYKCQSVISVFCDIDECGEREFGKHSGDISDFDFEQLYRVLTDPPYYRWVVNGQQLLFDNEGDLLNFRKFQILCLRHLNKSPKPLSAVKWLAIINNAFSNISEDNEDDSEFSSAAVFYNKIMEFFTRVQAFRKEQIMEGRVWVEELDNDLLIQFSGSKLREYLEKTNVIRYMSNAELHDKLLKLGVKSTKRSIGYKQVRIKQVSVNLLKKLGFDIDIKKREDLPTIKYLGEDKF